MDPEIERAGRGGECGEVRERMKDEEGKQKAEGRRQKAPDQIRSFLFIMTA